MRRRKLLLGTLLGLALLAGCALFVLWPRPSRVTRENFLRIQLGMSRAEVEAILGAPGDYTTGPGEKLRSTTDGSEYPEETADFPKNSTPADWVQWSGDAGDIQVCYGPGGARYKSFWRSWRIEKTPLDNLRWRAERLWRRWFPE